jgi:Rieske Fe-S protein
MLPRRTVVTAAGLAVVALPACATYDSTKAPASAAAPPAAPPAGAPSASGPAAAAPPAAALVQVADVPVGGGTIVADKETVVTQPTAGTFVAFDSTCTHQGCTVGEVANGTINCPCHGSKFRIADGAVANGPASRPLARRNITVTGGAITMA